MPTTSQVLPPDVEPLNVCPTCKRTIRNEHDCGPFCSEFCATVTDKEREEWLNAKQGDYVVYPCPECGCPVEGEWDPDPHKAMGSCCANKVRLRERTDVLKKALSFLPEDLRKEAEASLSW